MGSHPSKARMGHPLFQDHPSTVGDSAGWARLRRVDCFSIKAGGRCNGLKPVPFASELVPDRNLLERHPYGTDIRKGIAFPTPRRGANEHCAYGASVKAAVSHSFAKGAKEWATLAYAEEGVVLSHISESRCGAPVCSLLSVHPCGRKSRVGGCDWPDGLPPFREERERMGQRRK